MTYFIDFYISMRRSYLARLKLEAKNQSKMFHHQFQKNITSKMCYWNSIELHVSRRAELSAIMDRRSLSLTRTVC